jgi:hypothetical protein
LFQDLLWDASSGIPNRQTDDFGIDLYLNLYSWASGIAVYSEVDPFSPEILTSPESRRQTMRDELGSHRVGFSQPCGAFDAGRCQLTAHLYRRNLA